MTHSDGTILNVGDDQVVIAINRATTRLIIVSPGVSLRVAEVISHCWRRLGANNVKVVLDVDPEVCRLGYGEAKALECLQTVAAELRAEICHQRGVRICLVVSDKSILVFSPTPLVVEARSPLAEHPNGLNLNFVPVGLESDLGLGDKGKEKQTIGLNSVSSERVEEALEDLKQNPPRKFDVTQRVQVFNAAFDFVEFSVEGCSLSRTTVQIPSDLVGLGRDPRTQKMLRSTFKLIDEEDTELSGAKILKLKKLIQEEFLVNLPNYGNVVVRTKKAAFEKSVEILKQYVDQLHRKIEAKLQVAMDRNRKALVDALTPAVVNNPPPRWTDQALLFFPPSPEKVAEWLDLKLKLIFGNAATYLKRMDVTLTIKGVTYELLSDPEFIAVAKKHLPELQRLHEEFDTAKVVSEEPKEEDQPSWGRVDESSKAVN